MRLRAAAAQGDTQGDTQGDRRKNQGHPQGRQAAGRRTLRIDDATSREPELDPEEIRMFTKEPRS